MHRKILNLLMVILFLSINSIVMAGPPLIQSKIDETISANRTDEFESLIKSGQSSFDIRDRPKLKKYTIIFVGGFLSDLLSVLKEENFKQQINWMQEELGLVRGEDFIQAPVNTFAETPINVKILSDLIQKNNREVILVGHSKGGLDILDTLVQNPGLRNKVKGVITIQSPFWGSHIVPELEASLFYRNMFAALLRSGGGTYQTLTGLGIEERNQYMQKNSSEIEEVLREVPFMGFVGWLERGHTVPVPCKMHDGLTHILNMVTGSLNISSEWESDNLVPKDHQIFQGMDFVLVPGVDHLAPVMPSHYVVDKVAILRSLLSMLLDRIQDF